MLARVFGFGPPVRLPTLSRTHERYALYALP